MGSGYRADGGANLLGEDGGYVVVSVVGLESLIDNGGDLLIALTKEFAPEDFDVDRS